MRNRAVASEATTAETVGPRLRFAQLLGGFMAEGRVDVKFDREFFAVMVRACIVTNAVDTMLFGDVDAAKAYCHVRWKIPPTDWDAYLVASDPQSTMKLNGEGVRYCGWKHDKDETETIHIHLERKVVEF